MSQRRRRWKGQQRKGRSPKPVKLVCKCWHALNDFVPIVLLKASLLLNNFFTNTHWHIVFTPTRQFESQGSSLHLFSSNFCALTFFRLQRYSISDRGNRRRICWPECPAPRPNFISLVEWPDWGIFYCSPLATFVTIVVQISMDFLTIWKTSLFKSRLPLVKFWANIGKLWLLFILEFGHTDRECSSVLLNWRSRSSLFESHLYLNLEPLS